MNSEMQRRLYEMEVAPPLAVWEKLSVNIDEINEDNRLAKKISDTEIAPPLSVWERINSTINVVVEKQVDRRRPAINLRRMALAAILIGVIATGWVVFQNMNQKPTSLAIVPAENVQKAPSNETGSDKGIEEKGIVDSPVDISIPKNTIASTGTNSPIQNNNKHYSQPKTRNTRMAQSSPVQYASLSTPLAKSFDRSIDDLSLVTSDQHYLTMVNANGRMVKIPAQLASLAPHLQDKPIPEDIYEVMFGEGTYWKETLTEWRKKVASVPVASGDAFTSFIELLKSVQDK
jgi:hypothetical protein